MEAYCDGGCRGNGTSAMDAYGSFRVVDWKSGLDETKRLTFGSVTNNAAEYLALIALLEYLKAKNFRGVKIWTDSALLVNQVLGKWKVSAIHLREYRDKAAALRRETESMLDWLPRGNIVDKLGH